MKRTLLFISVLILASLACSSLSTPVSGCVKAPDIPAEVDPSLIPGIGFTQGGEYFTRKAGGWLVSADVTDYGEEHFYLSIKLNGPDLQSISFRISDIECTEIRGQKIVLKQSAEVLQGKFELIPYTGQ